MQPWSQKRSSLTCWHQRPIEGMSSPRRSRVPAKPRHAGSASIPRSRRASTPSSRRFTTSAPEFVRNKRPWRTISPTCRHWLTQSHRNVTRSRASSRRSARPFATHTNIRQSWALITSIVTMRLVKLGPLVAPARTNATIRTTTATTIAMMAKATAEGGESGGSLQPATTALSARRLSTMAAAAVMTRVPR